jgi:hypothetical protein
MPLALIALCLTAQIFVAGCSTEDNPTDPGTPPITGSTEWRLVESGITNTVRAMTSNDTMVVAVGDGGIIFSSTDGRLWTERRKFGSNDALTDIVWTGDRFIAVGWNSTLISSPNGITWTWIGVDPQRHINAVAVSDTLLIAVGSYGSVWTSRHGLDWLPLDLGNDEVFDVIHANGQWLIGTEKGMCYSSEDAVTWTPQITSFPDDDNFDAFACSDDLFYGLVRYYSPHSILPQSFHAYSSADGVAWSSLGRVDAWNISDICWTGTELVAVGEGTNYHLGMPDGLVFSSTGGAPFVEHTTEAPFALTTAEMFKGELLVGGSGGYILGGTQASDLSVRTSDAPITGVVWNGTEYVAVTARGTIMKSTNGENWSEEHSQSATEFKRLAFSGSKYVTLGGIGAALEIYTSADTDSWTITQTFDNAILSDVIWGGGNFVACGQQGAVYLSSDGETWSRQYVGESVSLKSVCYDGTRYLAATKSIVYTSDDGINWTKLTVDQAATVPIIESLIWTGSEYATVGNDNAGGGFVHTSVDAINWTAHELGEQVRLNDIAWTGNQYVICGHEGTLLTSEDAENWTTIATGTDKTLTSIETHGDQTVVVGANRTVLVQP